MKTIDEKDLLVWLKSLARGHAFPLDMTEVHESMDDAEEYVASPTAYEGQTIKVKQSDGKYRQYIVQPSENGYVLEEIIHHVPVIEF